MTEILDLQDLQELLQQALSALEDHREQTRAIHENDVVIESIRSALNKSTS
jgi:hypothetical protein